MGHSSIGLLEEGGRLWALPPISFGSDYNPTPSFSVQWCMATFIYSELKVLSLHESVLYTAFFFFFFFYRLCKLKYGCVLCAIKALLPTGSEERGILGVWSIPDAIIPSCQDMKSIAL